MKQNGMENADRNKVLKGRSSVHRLFGLFIAHARCEWYLMTSGCARGERKVVAVNNRGRQYFVATAAGKIGTAEIKIGKIFYVESR